MTFLHDTLHDSIMTNLNTTLIVMTPFHPLYCVLCFHAVKGLTIQNLSSLLRFLFVREGVVSYMGPPTKIISEYSITYR
jgi:hypothetical protein